MKKVRKAVRTYLIDNNNVLVIKYTKNDILGYFDIPGGKIENGESSTETSIREFKEETGIDILEQEKVGRLVIEYPDRIYDFEVFICTKYKGLPITTDENESLWININKILKEDLIFASIYMLDEKHLNLLFNKSFDVHFVVDSNNKLINEI